MIDLYTFTTPNGRKASIMLEEVGLPYEVHKIDLGKGEQSTPGFLARNPNGKIPAIHDRDTGTTVFESGAILIYLAEKTGKLLPAQGAERYAVLQWLMFQMSAVGPMFGQLGFFMRASGEKNTQALERYGNETHRILKVLDGQLGQGEYLAGEYSIADIATYPWVQGGAAFMGLPLSEYPHVGRWLELLGGRQAVERGMSIP